MKTLAALVLLASTPGCFIFQPPSPQFRAQQAAIDQRNADERARRAYAVNAGAAGYANAMLAQPRDPPPREMECRPSGMRPDKMICTEY